MASLSDVTIIDVKKRLIPDKHYVYLLAVSYADSTIAIIRRRYNQFFNFQCSLLEKFPIEGSQTKSEPRIIPYLPGKIIFGRSHIKKVALERMKSLEDYCKAIINLPVNISQCDLVINFFRPSKSEICSALLNKNDSSNSVTTISAPYLPDQFKVLEDYEAKTKRELNLEKGVIVEAIEKNVSGWWLIRSGDEVGWVPCTYLEKQKCETALKPKIAANEKFYITLESYVAKNKDELSFLRGTVLEIITKNEDGWWLARHKEKEGLVPKLYLDKYEFAKFNMRKSSATKHVQFDMNSQQKNETSDSILTSIKTEKRYKTLANFKPESPGYVHFSAGLEVKVLKVDPSGWSFISVNGQKGWAPSTYLTVISDNPC